MCGERIVHVDTGKKIRGSIGPVQKSDHADKNGVLSSDQYRTKQVTVRIDCGHGKEDCHACEEKGAQSVVIAFVLKEEKDNWKKSYYQLKEETSKIANEINR